VNLLLRITIFRSFSPLSTQGDPSTAVDRREGNKTAPNQPSNQTCFRSTMRILGRFFHIPSGSTYRIVKLESSQERNRASALLYDRYMANCQKPWRFDPATNASGLRVEDRLVDGVFTKVLVDDFEETAHVGGVLSDGGKLLATSRILYRPTLPKQELEIERYRHRFPVVSSSTNALSLEEEIAKCDVECNRMAILPELSKKRSIMLVTMALMKDVGGRCVVSTAPVSFLQKIPFYSHFFKYEFKYEDAEEAAVGTVVANASSATACLALYSLAAGSVYIPSFSPSASASPCDPVR